MASTISGWSETVEFDVELSTAPLTERQLFRSNESVKGGGFGGAIAIAADDSTAVIAANSITGITASTTPGAVYVFKKIGGIWIQDQRIFASDSALNDGFGYALAISRDASFFVAANYDSVYVFTKSGTGYIQSQKIDYDVRVQTTASAVIAIAADGQTLVVGDCFGYSDGGTTGTQVGNVHVYKKLNGVWTRIQRLLPYGAEVSEFQGSYFGRSVAISKNGAVIVVGAPANQASSVNARVFVFRNDGSQWVGVQMLLPEASDSTSEFGAAVVISDDEEHVIIGAPYAETRLGGNDTAGVLYTYSKDGLTWTKTQRIVNDLVSHGGRFGGNISMSDDGGTAVVGAVSSNTPVPDAVNPGMASVYKRTVSGWVKVHDFYLNENYGSVRYGTAVAISANGSTALVGVLGMPSISNIPSEGRGAVVAYSD